MTTQITWNIVELERETADGFVFAAHFIVDAKDSVYSSRYANVAGFERPETLVPFSELTEEMVVGWVKEVVGEEAVAEIEAALQTQLDEQASPTKAIGKPW